jgi:hypothetical protein
MASHDDEDMSDDYPQDMDEVHTCTHMYTHVRLLSSRHG